MYLVTGGAGFIGSHLVEALVARGAQVRVLDDFSSGSWENLVSFADAIEVIEGDVADLPTVLSAMKDVEYVLHHAAVASVERSVQDPPQVHRVNVEGTLNVLLAARETNLRRLIFASSAAVYGDTEGLPLSEETPPRALSPYAASKVAGEAYIHAFVTSYNLPAVILRYFNVYGPRQDLASPYSGVISKFVAALGRGEPPTIFGDGHQTRDFIYVRDVVRANLMACTRPEAISETLNVAGGQQMSILRLAETLNAVMGLRLSPRFAPPRLGEVRHSQADVSRARRVLGWQAETALEVGLTQTIRWLSAHPSEI
jgi:UDP-glucose 4-epimerase